MKTNFDKINPRKVLGYLMASAMVFFASSVTATNHIVNIDSQTNTFAPAALTIDVGDSVTWINDGGYHNVDGTLATYPNNADGFGNGAANNAWTDYVWVCTMAGSYDYDCTPHVGLGMVGTIAANAPPVVDLTITTTVCTTALEVRLTGPFWSWDPTAGPIAVDNGDGTHTFTFSPAPTADMEYLLIVDGVQENLVAANSDPATADWSCTPVTDYWSYANRQWLLGSGDVTNTYGTCGACVSTTDGCMDSTASNYNSSATNDDGSCVYQATVNFSVDAAAVVTAGYDNVVINGSFSGWNGWGVTLLDPDGDGVYEGSLMVDAGTYEYVHALTGSADAWSGWGVIGNAPSGGSCEIAGTGNYGFTVASGAVLDISTVCFASCDPCAVSLDGCTDPAASNYDANATTDDGSCVFPCLLDAVTLNLYDQWDDGWGYADGSQSLLTIDGVDYTISAGTESFDLCIDLTACTDVIFTPANGWSSENSWDIVDASGVIIASGGNNSGDVGACAVLGCTDAAATNYNAAADTDDGSCVYPCLDNAVVYTAGSYASENSFTITDCDGNLLAEMTSGTLGYDACIVLPAVYSVNLTDSYGDSWNGGSLSIDGVSYTQSGSIAAGTAESFQVGACPVLGCTDTTAANYDAAADTDDGSCTYGVPGCVDALACNYDAAATADDGSCTYAVAGYDCAGACLSGEEVTLTLTGFIWRYLEWGNINN